MPEALAYPSAAGMPESGTPITKIRLDARLGGEQLAHAPARRVDLVTHEVGVGSSEVHELKDAELLGATAGAWFRGAGLTSPRRS